MKTDKDIPEYELVIPAYPQMIRVVDKSKTLEEYGINKNSVINIK